MRIVFALLAISSAVGAQTPAPDIWLARIAVQGTELRVEPPANATHRPGYDNQPSFSTDGGRLYFTSVRDDAQADIHVMDLATGESRPFLHTVPESEYSATPTPDGGAVSVIRVERDSTQRLWRLPLDGSPASVLLPGIAPVGYHAWADARTVAIFVLGQPNTLQIADITSGVADTIARSVGRSLHRRPVRDAVEISFVEKRGDADWWLSIVDVGTRAVRPLVRMPEGVEDYVWLPDGSALCGRGSTLLRWRVGATEWETVAELSSAGVHNVTRLAVSRDGTRLAIVADGGAD
ncbi:MAG TPA: hypothetical protein VFG84_08495 [Gemmatimonadaceae bacterium]|nr:hypothetical protein [Gemmatimonadaceae bacterium]